MTRKIAGIIVIGVALGVVSPFEQGGATETDKTLVAWVALEDLDERGGSVLTIQEVREFDGIVFAEREPRTWMAGSDFFRRTQSEQSYPEETAREELIQMAIVYKGDGISIYRNGEKLTDYEADNIDLLNNKKNVAVFGLRHLGGNGSVAGEIEDARIYVSALSADQIRSLRPNESSSVKPYAWWDFEGGEATDRVSRFTCSRMEGGARVTEGRLVLDQDALMVAARTEELANAAANPDMPPIPYEEETPTVPDEVPDNWLSYHLAHPGGPGKGYPGDPNAAFFYKGRYHLHYIYRNQWGFSYAHVSSKDMVHWKWHSTKLTPHFTGNGMFSGTGFFTKAGRPAIIYHGRGSGRNQLTFALDDKMTRWTEPQPMEVKKASGEKAKIRHWDPDCWLKGGTYYAISGGRPPLLMKSPDLEEWRYLGRLWHKQTSWQELGVDRDEDVSCPNMFKLGDRWMLLCVSHDLGCRYYLGDFKDGKYLPETHAMMNWKDRKVFAPESLLTADGRRVMWAWCHFDLPGSQTAIQSLPRELSFAEDGRLRIKPLRELKSLRDDMKVEDTIRVKSGHRYRLQEIDGDTLELNVTIEPTKAKVYGVSVFCGKKGKGFPITYRSDQGILKMGDVGPPLELREGEALNLRIFLDEGMIEVFANNRQTAVYARPHDEESTGISLFSHGDDLVASVKGWKMESIYGNGGDR